MRIATFCLPLVLCCACCSSPARTGEPAEIQASAAPAFENFPLQHAAAQEVAAAVERLFADRAANSLRTFADHRTNSLLVSGAPEDLARVRELVAELDRPAERATAAR